jgi:hypothetical protein
MSDEQENTRRDERVPMEQMEQRGATEWIAATSVAVQAATNLYQTIKQPKSPSPEKKND